MHLLRTSSFARPGFNKRRAGELQTSLLLTAYCLVLSAFSSGCAVLGFPSPRPLHPSLKEIQDMSERLYEDFVGVIHVHTNYSHDAHGTIESVARVANKQHIDFVILTEHNNLKALKEGRQGWYGSTLILVGMEISAAGGHYLALNVTEEIDRNRKTSQQIIDEVNRQGGLGFIAHPFFKKKRWTDWSVHGFTGIEGYNTAHDTLDENRLRLVLWTLTVPPEPFFVSLLNRPYDPLRKWDEMIARHGRITGIGASDAHEFHILGLKFAPYEVMFQLSRTHVLIPKHKDNPELNQDNAPSPTKFDLLTDSAVYEALRKGHAYFSIELIAEAKGFLFSAVKGSQIIGIMGDEITLEPGLELITSLPTAAELTLFHNGQPIASKISQAWSFPVSEPGFYRLEAMRHGKPWIFSNPIYIKLPNTNENN